MVRKSVIPVVKKIVGTGLLICLCLAPLSSFGDVNPQTAGIVTFMVGDVFVSADGEKWTDADFDMKVFQGDQVRTEAESRCEIRLEDTSVVRMEEKSLQQFEKSRTDTTTTSKGSSIFLSAGKIWLNARKIISRHDSFQVRTDKAVCAIRGTRFEVDAENSYTRISVYKGEVATWSSLFDGSENQAEKPSRTDSDRASECLPLSRPFTVAGPDPVTMEKWVEIVKAFQQITIDAEGRYEKQDLDARVVSKDPWISWNMARDNSTNTHP